MIFFYCYIIEHIIDNKYAKKCDESKIPKSDSSSIRNTMNIIILSIRYELFQIQDTVIYTYYFYANKNHGLVPFIKDIAHFCDSCVCVRVAVLL